MFADRLQAAGYAPRNVKLLRHDRRGATAWALSPGHFISFSSIQSSDHSPFARDPAHVAHFLPGPRLPSGGFSAYFLGMTRLFARWPWDGKRLPRHWLLDYSTPGAAQEAADQDWEPAHPDLPPGLIIDWGHAPRSWHQRGTTPKPIITTTGSLPLLKDLPSWLGTEHNLDAETRHCETLAFEERELSAAVAQNPEAVARDFDAQREELVTGRVRPRPNQRRFRDALIKRQGQICAVTGCTTADALEAAHIIPFAEGRAGRDLPSNGLLLRRDIHRLFDLLLLSVDPHDRTVWLAPSLRQGDYAALAAQPITADVSETALKEHFRRAVAAAL